MSCEKHKVVAGEICGNDLAQLKEAVCVQVEKIYDSCKEKDCIEDARVLLKDTPFTKWLLRNAINVKARRAEVCNVFADIEPVPFKRGFYTVDIKFFIRVTLDFFIPKCGDACNTKVYTKKGVVLFDKKVILFGSEGGVKIFKTHFTENGLDTPIKTRLQQDNLPISKVEVAEPIALSARFAECREEHEDCMCLEDLAADVSGMIDDEPEENVEYNDDDTRGILRHRKVLVTVGLFSIVKLVRFVQLLIPAFDFCVPNKKCIAATEENPCELFDTIEFPVEEFYPPQKFDFPGAEETEHKMRKEMHLE